MKQVGKKKLEQLKLDIRLRTVTNGYALEVNDEGFMYFDAQSLLEGVLYPCGDRTTGDDDEGRGAEDAQSHDERQHCQDAPGRGNGTEGSGAGTEEADQGAEESD